MFSLDVGTRTLVGVIADFDEEENLIIKNTFVKEHESRAMLDGQIHDVDKVARTASKVISKLEEESGEKIKDVSVALAGRFLITKEGEYDLDIQNKGYLNSEIVRKMELEAVKSATESLGDIKGLYCIGYSVLYYEIDGEWIKHLEGQKGLKAKVKVISAFLPKNVVEAMLSVLEKNNLNPVHITLEPIAAMNIVVPEDLRNLNIVMVDVGAGTSDIAVSRDGTIIGYGMVPMAGDEITDAISKELLIDFNTSEIIKKSLYSKDKFSYFDVLDFEHEITKEEIIEIIDPQLDIITKEISKRILDLNGKPPVAVMVVGGGGKVIGFVDKLHKNLGIPKNRVALKDLSKVNKIKFEKDKLQGSEFITPIGIAYVALKKEGNVFNSITVNNNKINMMMIGNDLNVMQVLLQAGFSSNQLIGSPSPALTYEIDDELKIIKGNLGKEAEIIINGKKGNLKSKLKPGDDIKVGNPKNGVPLQIKLKDISPKIKFFLNGKPHEINLIVYRNDKKLNLEDVININDKLYTKPPKIKEILKEYTKNIYFTISGTPYEIPCGVVITKNGEIIEDNYEIKDKDSFETNYTKTPKVGDFIEVDIKKRIIKFNKEELLLPIEEVIIKQSGKIIEKNDEIKDGANYIIEKVEKNPSILELLAHLSIDIKKINSFKITINGEDVESFMQEIPENSYVKFSYE